MSISSGSLDTCVVIRILLNDIPDQHERAKLLANQQGASYHISDLAIAEAVYVLQKHYQFKRTQVEDFLISLIARPNLNLNRQIILSALPHFLSNPTLSFNDCLISAYAKLNEALPVFTFDKAFAKKLPETVEL